VLQRLRNDSGAARLAIALGVAGALAAGGTGALLVSGGASPLATALGGPSPTPAPTVGVAVGGARGTTVPWDRPLRVAVSDGTLRSLTATGPGGGVLEGTLTSSAWSSTSTLVPGRDYLVRAQVVDANGRTSTYERAYRAAAAAKVLHAAIEDPGAVVGIGQPVIVRLDQRVRGHAARAAVMERLEVTTTPAVAGAWRWYNSFEAHYRAREYWKPGTTVSVRANLGLLRVPGTDVWGSTAIQSGSFTVGSAMQSVADIARHTLTVRRDGKVLRVLRMSAGSQKYPTKGGVHIVLHKEKEHLFNSATVGIPTASPEGYYNKLPWSVRISNGGAFVHAQPASVRSQGRRNVSHGCINLNTRDAQWFFGLAKRGDTVDVVNAVVKPTLWDAGMADWNYSWAQWSKGNLDE
jgi:lipoprotein-anchoring transpeptidase ErfK/SrfK